MCHILAGAHQGQGGSWGWEEHPAEAKSFLAHNQQPQTQTGTDRQQTRGSLKCLMQRLLLPLLHLSLPPSNSIPKRINTFGFHGSLIFNEHPSSPNRKESFINAYRTHWHLPGATASSPPRTSTFCPWLLCFSGLMGAGSLHSQRSRAAARSRACSLQRWIGQERESVSARRWHMEAFLQHIRLGAVTPPHLSSPRWSWDTNGLLSRFCFLPSF